MKKIITRTGRKILKLAFKHHLGKRRWSARVLFFILDSFGKFETYLNTNNTNEEHHYVPQLILRRFRVAEVGTDKGQIWQFSFATNLIEKKGIANSATITDFYTFKDIKGDRSDFIEKKVFSETLEYFGSLVIKQINTTSEEPDLTYLEESTLSVFIAYQITRVPAFYSAIEKYIVYCLENKNLEISDLGSFESMNKKIVLNDLGVSIDELLNYTQKIRIAGADNHIGSISRQIAQYIAEKIYRRNLHILDIPSTMDDRFVISDNPVVLLDFKRREILRYPSWWNFDNEDLWIFMPISPTRCVFFTRSKRKDSVIENGNEDFVRLVNFGQYLNASNFVFSKEERFLTSHLKMYSKELSDSKV